MPKNVFDQFDTVEPESNIFDQFDAAEPEAIEPLKIAESIEPEDDSFEITKGLKAGYYQTKGLIAGAGAAAGSAVEWDWLKDTGLEGYKEAMAEASKYEADVGRIEDIDNATDLANWGMYQLGNLTPTMATMFLTGGVGGVIAKQVAKKGIKELSEREAKKQLAKTTMIGQSIGAGTGATALETGGIYTDILEKTGEDRPGVALAFGTMAGSLDTIPVMRVFNKFGVGRQAKQGIAKNIAKDRLFPKLVAEAGKQGTFEGLTEGAQTIIERAAVKYIDENQDIFTEEGWSEIKNAMAAGALMGGVMGPITGVQKEPRIDPETGVPSEEFKPTHKAAGGVDVEPLVIGGNVIPDTYVDINNKIIRDATAVEVTAPAAPEYDPESFDLDANAEAIQVEVAGDVSTPVARQGIIDAAFGVDVQQKLAAERQREIDRTPLEAVVPVPVPAPVPEDITSVEHIQDEADKADASPNNGKIMTEDGELLETGNYVKGHPTVQGFELAIENPAGSVRKEGWPVMAHHYGDLTGTVGADGDPIDVFVKKDVDVTDDNQVFVVNQKDQKTGKFDEVKVMMGFDSAEDAKAGYLANYTADFDGFMDIVETNAEDLRTWSLSDDSRNQFTIGAKVEEIAAVPKVEERPIVEEAPKVKPIKKVVDSDSDIIKDAVAKYKSKDEVINYLNGRFGRSKTKSLKSKINELFEKEQPAKIEEVEAAEEEVVGEITVEAPGMQVQFEGKRYPIASFKDASEKFQQFIDQTGIASSQLSEDPIILDADGSQVAYLSYNGRVWSGESFVPGAKPLYDPSVEKKAERAKKAIEKPAEEVKPEPAPEPIEVKIDDAPAITVLDAANITGKERLDTMRDYRAGDITIDDLTAAYPAVSEPIAKEVIKPTPTEPVSIEAVPVEAKPIDIKEDFELYSGYEPVTRDLQIKQPSTPKQEQAQFDLFASPGIPEEAASSQAQDNFNIQYKQVEVGQFNTGVDVINSAEDAAHAIAPIRKHAQETMLAIVTDKDNKIISVIRHTKGLKDQSSVGVAELTAGIASTEGATGVWFAHNHPTGDTKPSTQDRNITGIMDRAMDASGVVSKGHVIVGDGATFNILDKKGDSVGVSKIPPFRRGKRISVTERVLRKRKKTDSPIFNNPSATRDYVSEMDTRNGLILLNTKNKVIGVVSMSLEEMGGLRVGNQVPRILKAIDETNAAAGIIVSEDSAIAGNLGNYLSRLHGFRLLDAMIREGDVVYSKAERGGVLGDEDKPFYRLEDEDYQPGDVATRSEQPETKPKQSVSVDRLKKVAAMVHQEYKGTQAVAIHIRDTQDMAFGKGSVERMGRIKGGFYVGSNEMILIAENIRNEAEVAMVIRHELVGHFGFRQLLNKEGEFDVLLDRVYAARNDELKDLHDWVIKTYPELEREGDARKIADEMLARSAEAKTKPRLITQIYEAIINLLRKYGIWRVDPTQEGAATMAEIERLVRLSRRNLRTKTDEGIILDQLKPDIIASREAAAVFYSQMQTVLNNKLPGKGTSTQFKKVINNLANKGEYKAEELEWSGVNEWLESLAGKKITKQEVIDFLKANQIQVTEIVKGGGDNVFIRGFATREELLDQVSGDDQLVTPNGELRRALEPYKKADGTWNLRDYSIDRPKYGDDKTVLPGGEDYRELLLTLPEKMPIPKQVTLTQASDLIANDRAVEIRRNGVFVGNVMSEFGLDRYRDDKTVTFNEYIVPEKSEDYISGHFKEPNILAHIRFNTRTDTDGNRVLFIEEVQSDWHQTGRKEGYKRELLKVTKSEKIGDNKWEVYFSDNSSIDVVGETKEIAEGRAHAEAERINEAAVEGVPDAPFKTTWPLLAMKRMMRYAVDNGYDSIAWTTGAQQTDRYDLSKQLERVEYWAMPDGQYGFSAFKIGDEGAPDIKKNFLNESDLENNLGKELANKIINKENPTHKVGDTQYGEFTGLDLKIGGEGMKGFYDQILPKTMNKYVKKWGGKVGRTDIFGDLADELDMDEMDALKAISVSDYVHNLPITDKMRETAIAGQPMFKRDEDGIAEYCNVCDKLRKTKEGEEKWQRMMNTKVEITEDKFLDNVDINQLPVLDEDESWDQYYSDNPDIKFYESDNEFFYQTAGFEFIWNKDDSQITDRIDAGIAFRREDEPVGSNLGLPEEGYTDKFVRLFQDSFNRLKKIQATIEERGGVVSPEADVYRAEERYSGKASQRLDRLDKTYMRPLVKQMADDGITLEELDNYLAAKHAPERNAYIASINPEMPDGGSGMTNAEASTILDELSDKTIALETAANTVYAVNQQNQRDLVEAGLLTQEVVDEWNERWNYYVPLKGKEGEEGRPGTGAGFNVVGAGIRSALGRGEGNVAESPTAHSFAQTEAGIVRAEKAQVGQAFVQLVRDNPDPEFWSINETTYNNFVDMYGIPFQGYMEGEVPEGLVENFDYHRTSVILPEERKAAQAEGRAPIPTVVMKIDPKYRQRDDVFSVMENGVQLDIKIKDALIAEQLKRLNSNQLNAVTATFGQVNRYLAMINTALNPEFVITNLERDFQTAMINLSGEHSAKMAADVAKSMPGAMRGIWQSTFDTKGRSEWRTIYDEMREEGGAIGFFGLEDIDTKIRTIQNKLETRDTILGKTKRGILNVRDVVLDSNLAVENSARLAAYRIARDKWIANGMPEKEAKQKAASLSKNLTVNFNRKGELAPVLNSAYLFYNASIQGSARIFTALTNKRVQKIAAGIAVTAFANALYNMVAGGDDEDGIPFWDKIPDYTKQTNIIIMHPDGSGNYSKIKLPYGYNVFWYTGTAMSEMMYNPRKSVVDTVLSMGSAVMNAFNPIQGADMLDTIVPTVLKPFEQDVRNINFMGGPIRPEFKFDAYERPDSQKVFKSTNPVLRDMIQAVNAATGGDETHAGFVDFSPETMKHYTNWLTGGMGMTGARAIGTAIKLATDEEIEMRDVPFARTLGGKPSKRFDTERFYGALEEISAVKAQLNIYRGTDKYSEYKTAHNEVYKLSLRVSGYKKQIKHLRKQRDDAYASKDKGLAKEYSEKIRSKMMKFSMLFEDAIKAQQ